MKVVLIYRPPRRGAHSIETLFEAVASELSKHVEVITYKTSARWLTALDVWRLRRMRADVYHVTGGVSYFACFVPRRASVLTVHDIGNYLYGLQGIKRWIYRALWLEAPMAYASAVTAVSEKTRDDIAAHLAAQPDVHVVQNCHSPSYVHVPRAFDNACPRILQVGTQPYKNVPRVIEALQGIPCRFVLVGKLDEETRRRLEELQIDFENHVDVSHEELVQQYVDCDMVTFASTGEGFGLPIIEAQASGRPLVTSNVSPLCDVAGLGACLVDPTDVASIRRGLQRVIDDPAFREEITARGVENAARYSPAAAARAYLAIYERLTV